MQHLLCDPNCDFRTTLKVWQAIPQSAVQAVVKWIAVNFGHADWRLHAMLPTYKCKNAMLRINMDQFRSETLLDFMAERHHVSSEAAILTRVEDPLQVTDNSPPQVDHSQPEIEQLRYWLVSKGLSSAKTEELETEMTGHMRLA